jgi:hypothetical protein
MKTISYIDNGGRRIIAHEEAAKFGGDSIILSWDNAKSDRDNHKDAAGVLADILRIEVSFCSSSASGSVFNWRTKRKEIAKV